MSDFQSIPHSMSLLPKINWLMLGHVVLTPGEHKQLTDAEIGELNRILDKGYFTVPYAEALKDSPRMAELFQLAKDRYTEHLSSLGNAGAPEDQGGDEDA